MSLQDIYLLCKINQIMNFGNESPPKYEDAICNKYVLEIKKLNDEISIKICY